MVTAKLPSRDVAEMQTSCRYHVALAAFRRVTPRSSGSWFDIPLVYKVMSFKYVGIKCHQLPIVKLEAGSRHEALYNRSPLLTADQTQMRLETTRPTDPPADDAGKFLGAYYDKKIFLRERIRCLPPRLNLMSAYESLAAPPVPEATSAFSTATPVQANDFAGRPGLCRKTPSAFHSLPPLKFR